MMDAGQQETRQAHHRASVKWLLAKAFNNNVPDNLREPFYTDHDNQERLKPQIVVEMGNATLYCQTLSNIYSDPNYQSLNHWSILQTLSRKGVPVAESPEMPLTETVLIQTNPLRINAHMSVIQSLMTLYAKEITSGERIANAVARITGNNGQTLPHDQPFDQLLLLWISHACTSLKKRIAREVELGATDENGVRLQVPNIPAVHDYQSLCDGVCLALFISYYCPKALPWTLVRINYLPAVEDSVHNVSLVSNFCQKYLPYHVFHMNPEDVTFMRNSMKLNLVVLLADLFLLFEIHPAKCVCYPGMDAPEIISKRYFGVNEHGICHRRGLTMQPVIPIPDLRSDSDSNYGSPTNRPPFQVTNSASASELVYGNNSATLMQNTGLRNSENEAFVVHKSRGVTTLSSLHSQQQQQHNQQQQEPLVPARLRQSKEKSNTETKADERGDFVPAGRPSNWEQNRRPSYAGRRSRRNSSSEDSQLTIENFGGSQDQLNAVGRFERERERERERKLSNVSVVEPAVAVRSSIADARGTLQLGYDTDSGSEKQDRETEKYLMKRHASTDNVNMNASNTQLNSIVSTVSSPMPSTRRHHAIEKDNLDEQYAERKDSSTNDYEQTLTRRSTQSSGSSKVEAWNNSKIDPYDDDLRTLENASKLSTIRMKLEEKRLRIEQDKRRIEMALLRHQEKLAREDLDASSEVLKWETLSNDSNRTPDLDPLDLDKYQQSLAIMNMNLQDIQQDIQKLTVQQNQIQAQQLQAQQLMHAQHMANMLNQPPYGSQQHLSDNFNQMQMQQQQQQHNFGSTPHLAHSSYNPHANLYNSRPPSRDPYQQQQQQPQMPSMPMQYINEHGQYVSQQQQPPPPMMQQQPHYMQPQKLYNDNMVPYNNHVYGGPPQYAAHHNQTPPQYMNRASMYDDYGRDPSSPQPNPMYPHEMSPQPTQPQRRTWNQSVYEQQQQQQQQQQQYQHQQSQAPLVDVNAWQQQKQRSCLPMDGNYTWKKSSQMPGNGGREGFVLHQNDGGGEYQHLFRSSPQHMQHNSDGGGGGGGGLQRQHSISNMPMTTKQPPTTAATSSSNSSGGQQLCDDMMAPQSICFIGDEDDVEELERNIIESMQNTRIADYAHQQQQYQMQQQQQQQQQQHQHYQQHGSDGSYDGGNELLPQKLHITSGNLTYRIPSPSRPAVNANSFQDPRDAKTEKGFYISFDDNQPKRPKPPLRAKRSPKKERSMDSTDHQLPGGAKLEPLNRAHSISEDNNPTYNGGTLLHAGARQYGAGVGNMDTLKNGNAKLSDINTATYNKYTDAPIQLRHDDLNSQKAPVAQPRSPVHQFNVSATSAALSSSPPITRSQQHTVAAAGGGGSSSSQAKALVIGTDVSNLDRESIDEMERRKEKIMLQSLQRRQQQEEAKARKEIEAARKREMEREKEEEKARKKEEQMARRAAILEQHRLKKAIEEAEREGKTLDRTELTMKQSTQNSTTPRLRQTRPTRPRPKTIHVDDGSVDLSEASSISSRSKKGSSTNLTAYGTLSNSNTLRRDFYRGSHDSLTVKESPDEYPSTSSTPIGRRGSYKASREPTVDRGRSRISVAKGSSLNFRGRKSNSLMNLCDSGLGRATPPRRAPSPGMASGRHMPSPSGPGSLPPGLISKRRGFDDGSGLLSANLGSMEYSGPKLYKQPAAKSNRGIILNAVEYCVFPGAVNREAKQKVLEKIARSEAKHFLVLFRDAGCQFRALYSYVPELDQVTKLYGTGPSQVDEVMFDKFFKYNSGGKCFSQVHTKHLTVTIDAFTIHNSLWQGKKVHLPSKKDMALVI